MTPEAKLLSLVMNEHNSAKTIQSDFDTQGMTDSAEMWGLVVARLGRVLDDYADHITSEMKAKA